jgi:hypothetical protein
MGEVAERPAHARNARVGSRRDARRAGAMHDTRDAPAMSATTQLNTSGSCGPT